MSLEDVVSPKNIHPAELENGKMTTRQKIPRRRFLNLVGAAVAAESASLRLPSAYAALNQGTSSASRLPRLLAGCCAYSYSRQLKSGLMTLEDFILKAVELRVDAVDVTAYYLKSAEPDYLESIRYLAYRNAVMFSGAACGVSMVQADPDQRLSVLDKLKKWVDVTNCLGASHLRVFAGAAAPGTKQQQAIDMLVEIMKQATHYSSKQGVVLGIEDHQGLSQNADICLEIMHRVDSPYAGINLDITHFVPTATKDAYEQIESCIPFATNTHIRDRFDDGTSIDMDRVWRMFVRQGFRGFMSAEYESNPTEADDSTAAVPKLIATIRMLNKKYSSI
jgi:sugar phosphate isomerase/epimerase